MAAAFVQSITTGGSGGGTYVTNSITPTAGNTVVAVIGSYDGGGGPATVVSITLSGGGSFSLAKASSGTVNRCEIWYLSNVAGGAQTATVTFSGSFGFQDVFLVELSGITNSSPVDGAGATATGTSTTPSSGAYTILATSIAVGGTQAAGLASFTASAGWTTPASGVEAGSSGAAVHYRVPGSTSVTSGGTLNDSRAWAETGVAFLAAGAATTTVRSMMGIGT